MKQEISALMDGELFDDEAEAILDKLKRNPDKHDEWLTRLCGAITVGSACKRSRMAILILAST